MKKFTTGYLVGTAVTLAALTSLAYGLKKIVIEPVEEKEAMIDDSRKKAMRKSRAR
ncbi:DUF3042 domain-containing protein [Vagococcus penaei]|uniref:DUF3042 domain-containing protein n=1 Tax=Vagococcus penaei TaxID=633807 RepID=A0A1Q2D467_9ENTE|nr:DUF3042 family protein [Vagococcus penaei]AQP53184.1 DUF3042 domain-containing protein [Vagococcus penaei]RSU00985.1 DUF3042 domain-containing protein [Vagococcus penaei]